ncbi:MAG: T9SS type A sorting domain-containing protein [Hyphomicrobiales bacterium]
MKKNLRILLLLLYTLLVNAGIAGENKDYDTGINQKEHEEDISNIPEKKLIFKDFVKKIYPNPVKNDMTIVFNKKYASKKHLVNIKFLNILGNNVKSSCKVVLNGKVTINDINLKEGMYFLKINDKLNFDIAKVLIQKD